MPYVLWWVGVVSGLWLLIGSVRAPGNDKHGVVAFPFIMLLAAAVARYLGL